MTYRQAIQKLQDDIDKLYDLAGVMRDCADKNEKEPWNNFRSYTRNAYMALGILDNQLTDLRAQMELGFDV